MLMLVDDYLESGIMLMLVGIAALSIVPYVTHVPVSAGIYIHSLLLYIHLSLPYTPDPSRCTRESTVSRTCSGSTGCRESSTGEGVYYQYERNDC